MVQLLQDSKMQSYIVPDSAEKGYSAIVRNRACEKGFVGFLKVPADTKQTASTSSATEEKGSDDGMVELDTAWKLISRAMKTHGKRPFIGFRKFEEGKEAGKLSRAKKYDWLTYDDFNEYVMAWGNGLRGLDGIEDKCAVGIYSSNRPEWYATHCANISQSYRTVALYDTLGPDSVSFITRHAELPVMSCTIYIFLSFFLSIAKSKLKSLSEWWRVRV